MIPLRTDIPIRRTPRANHALLAINAAVFFVGDYLVPEGFAPIKHNVLALDAALPEWWQFFTYQFLHGDYDWGHLLGNLLFLWVFGNAVNSKLGHIPYILFYLAGGAFAGWGYAINHHNALIGASGSIAAITTAYMVFFPRSRILFLFWFFIITTFELPGLWVILIKIILWDNLISPRIVMEGQMVAYSAHLYGYAYGFIASMGLLLVGAVPRDQFDLVAVIRRWNQRRVFSAGAQGMQAKLSRMQNTPMARPVTINAAGQGESKIRFDRIAELRVQIGSAISDPLRRQEAIDLFEQLMQIDSQQVLSRSPLLEIGRIYYSDHRYPQAVGVFEKFLKHYPKADEADEIQLLLGIIYARDLEQYEVSEKHLQNTLEKLSDPGRREQCQQWLEYIRQHLKPAAPPANPN